MDRMTCPYGVRGNLPSYVLARAVKSDGAIFNTSNRAVPFSQLSMAGGAILPVRFGSGLKVRFLLNGLSVLLFLAGHETERQDTRQTADNQINFTFPKKDECQRSCYCYEKNTVTVVSDIASASRNERQSYCEENNLAGSPVT